MPYKHLYYFIIFWREIMPYAKTDLEKLEKLHSAIESRKKQENAAPTYRDSSDLRKMTEIALSPREEDIETLEETISALRYLTKAYDKMCRTGISVKLYTPLLSAYARLSILKEFDSEDMAQLEECLLTAVRARNYYKTDCCIDLAEIVSKCMPENRIRVLLDTGIDSRRNFIKNDPVEMTDEYLAVIDEVEEQIEKKKTSDFCLEYWNLKAQLLSSHGIVWHSPAELNPNARFD